LLLVQPDVLGCADIATMADPRHIPALVWPNIATGRNAVAAPQTPRCTVLRSA